MTDSGADDIEMDPLDREDWNDQDDQILHTDLDSGETTQVDYSSILDDINTQHRLSLKTNTVSSFYKFQDRFGNRKPLAPRRK